jgi:hypothetical protein
MRLAPFGLAAVLATAGIAQAQTASPAPPASPDAASARAQVREACASDVQKLCPDLQGREVRKCLRQNLEKASAACRDAVSKAPRRGGHG